MDKIEAFQAAARQGGFVMSEATDEGSVLWLKKATGEAEERICIDTVTKIATAYWATIPWKINSTTFRDAAALLAWVISRPNVSAPSKP